MMASYMKFHQLCRNMLVMMSLIEAFTTHCTKKTRVYTTLNVLTGSESGRPTWQVFVDQSKLSLDKGGSATLDAFLGLAPSSKANVLVQPAILPRTTKSKGPIIRCINELTGEAFEVGSVDSVDKVSRILTKHMKIRVNATVCECLKWKYRGNGHLEDGKVTLAIDAYDKALAIGVTQQEGPVLLMRASAFLQRAAGHKDKLKESVGELVKLIPDSSNLVNAFDEAKSQPVLASSIFRRILEESGQRESQFRRTQYRHGLYQYALLAAAQDALKATELLPNYALSWLKAGEILSELWKLEESTQYFERAMELDPSLVDVVTPVIKRLRKRQQLLKNARGYGWSDSTLRLALDATG